MSTQTLIKTVIAALVSTVSACAFAQVDSTKNNHTVAAVVPPPAPLKPEGVGLAATVVQSDLTFAGFLKTYAGKSFSTDFTTLTPYFLKKAYVENKVGYFGPVRYSVDVTQNSLCIRTDVLQYGISRRACIDPQGNVFGIWRGYGLIGGLKGNDTLIYDHGAIYNADGDYLYDMMDYHKISAVGVEIFLPLVGAGGGQYKAAGASGTCVAVTRDAFQSGRSAYVYPCTGL